MLKLGDYNTLRITRFTDHGAYLDAGEMGEILLPKAYVRREMRPNDEVTVFVYLDQQERLVGTFETPLARVGQFACLKVAWVNEFGAFLDWGLMKDLFVPFREQKKQMEVGRSYIIYVYIDEETCRIAATAKVEKFLQPATADRYYRGKQVELLVQQKTPLGFKVIVDNACPGMIYDDQILIPPHTGDRLTGSVVTVRPDGKLDVALGLIGKSRFRDFADTLLEKLEAAGGRLPYTDSTPAEVIADRLGVSKKTFKRAVGNLYRAHRIRLDDEGIELLRPRKNAAFEQKK